MNTIKIKNSFTSDTIIVYNRQAIGCKAESCMNKGKVIKTVKERYAECLSLGQVFTIVPLGSIEMEQASVDDGRQRSNQGEQK